MTPTSFNYILWKITVLLKRQLKIKAGKDDLCCASAEQLFGCFQNEAYFPSARFGTSVSFMSLQPYARVQAF